MEDLKYTEILRLNKALIGTIDSRPYEIGILSNVTVNSFKEIVEYLCRSRQIEPNVEIGNFDNIVQDSAVFNQKDLVVVFYDILNIVDQVSEFFEDLDEEKYTTLKDKLFTEIDIVMQNLSSTASVIFNSFSSAYFNYNTTHSLKIESFVEELNQYLEDKKGNNVTVVNLDKIFSRIGFKSCIDYRFYNSSKAPYTSTFLKSYCVEIENVILRNTGKLKKAIIFDCDGTLWKGVIGEEGMEGVEMSPDSIPGKYYHEIQKIAVHLGKKGIIVGLCSKNNEQDVLEVLHHHKDIVLREEDIVIHKINWTDKATNLREIASELNIGIDSLVFVDDSHFEINLIKEQLPEVLTIQVPSSISEYPDQLLQKVYANFNLVTNSDDAKKTVMYKQQVQREVNKQSHHSIDDYLASLEIEVTIVKDDTEQIPRIAQLTQKTNQFNLTTIRYTENEIQQFMEDDKHSVYSIFVSDKFGESGLTGICIINEDESDSKNANIDTLLMSCRVIGRNIEYEFINHIIKDIAKREYETISAQYVPTAKNALVADFFEKAGLNLIETKDGMKEYKVKLNQSQPKQVDYINIRTEFSKS